MALFEASRGALSRIEDAELEIARLQGAPRGTLKVNVPMSFGLLHIAPSLHEFLKACPELSVDLAMEDRFVNLVDEGYDLAIRITRLADSALVARKLAPCRQVVCASPEYLARHGCPSTPEDLSSHNCVIYSYLPPVWRFNDRAGREIAAPVRGNLRVNNGIAQREAALSAVGITLIPTFYVGELIREQRLAVVLNDYSVPEIGVYAVYPQRKYLSPKVRAFVEFLGKRFGSRPPWDRF
jgi:DNA-binding transcriptional LysR family regulator